MTEADKILAQIDLLFDAQAEVRRKNPDDPGTFKQLTLMITDLQLRYRMLMTNPEIPALTKAQVDSLQAAQEALERAVNDSEGVTEILEAATALVQS